MNHVNGVQAQRISEALRTAFLPDALDELLFFALGKKREDFTLADSYRGRIFQLIRFADSEGWLFALVLAARQARPADAVLYDIAVELGLSAGQPGYERIIHENVPFVDVSAWRTRLGTLEAQVCQVEVTLGSRTVMGTGFLVGADLCLTNYHVVQDLITGAASPVRARLLFDYKRAADGTVVSAGTPIRLADDWLVSAKPPSAADLRPVADDHLPSADELDFALLRLRGEPGNCPLGERTRGDWAPTRGWIDHVGSDGFGADDPMFILQYPNGAPLKLSFGQSLGLNANATRLLHRVNTEGGASGSPCFNARLELVGMHHAGDPNFEPGHRPRFNSAIPFHAISARVPAEVKICRPN